MPINSCIYLSSALFMSFNMMERKLLGNGGSVGGGYVSTLMHAMLHHTAIHLEGCTHIFTHTYMLQCHEFMQFVREWTVGVLGLKRASKS